MQEKHIENEMKEATQQSTSKGIKKPIAIDLFSGCGGLTLGLKKAGFNVVAAVDIDPLSASTYRANHAEVLLMEQDIRHLKPAELLKQLRIKKGQIDLLAGCPPCQGFSTLRTLKTKASIDDPRNDLVMDFLHFVKLLRPRSVMMENVPGLEKDILFKSFCIQMKKIGYIGEHRVLNAADYAVPQRRKRLVYLAGLGMKVPFANKSKKTKTVKETIGGLKPAGKSGDPLHDIPEYRTSKVLEIIRSIPKDGGNRKDLPERLKLECHKKCSGFNDVYGRIAWNDVAPTITSGCFNPSKGRFIHPEENRAITLREAALLQGFPRYYKFPISNNKTALGLMIGNALPPPFVTAHGKKLFSIL